MRALAISVLLLSACGSARPVTTAAVAPSPVVIAPVAPAPVGSAPVVAASVESSAPVVAPLPIVDDPPVGAVPIPDALTYTLDEVDTTVTDAELARITGWPLAKRSRRGGEVWVVLHAGPDQDQQLQLSVVKAGEGILERWPLGPATPVSTNHTQDGDAYSERGHSGDYKGRILFAVRVVPPGATTPDQIVVFRSGSTLRAARRTLGTTTWRPILSVAFARGSTFVPIGTRDPH